jgi:hypothetical protein
MRSNTPVFKAAGVVKAEVKITQTDTAEAEKDAEAATAEKRQIPIEDLDL